MIEYLIAMGIAAAATVCIYRIGLKDGQNIKHDKSIEPLVKSPAKAFNELLQESESKKIAESEKQQASEFIKGFNNLMEYTGEKQKEIDR